MSDTNLTLEIWPQSFAHLVVHRNKQNETFGSFVLGSFDTVAAAKSYAETLFRGPLVWTHKPWKSRSTPSDDPEDQHWIATL